MQTKEQRKEYLKAYYQAHKEDYKAKNKEWYEAHKEQSKEQRKAAAKAWYEAHKEQKKAKNKEWYEAHKEQSKAYYKSDVNALGQTKKSIRHKSLYILKKSGIKIHGYQIHHCFTYDDPSKFIYCSKELHMQIHQYLRDNSIDADSNHYEQIKHLLDEKVITFGL